MSADQVASFLKMKLEQRSTNLTQAFRKLDKSNTGYLSSDDFAETLSGFNIRLTRQALAAVVAKYDANGDGFVSYQEFCAVMAGRSSAALKNAPAIQAPSATDVAEANLRRLIYAASESVTAAFLRINRNRNGSCDRDELARVFRSASIPLTPEEFTMVVGRCDTNKDGKVDLVELSKLMQVDLGGPAHMARGQKRARS